MAEGGHGGNEGDGIFIGLLVFVMLAIFVYAISFFFPQFFITPLYYVSLSEAWISHMLTFTLNSNIAAEYHYLADRDPSYFTINSITMFTFTGHWYPAWILMFSITGGLAYWASTKHGRYRVGKDVQLTPDWLISNLDPWYPHLAPLQIIDPLKYPVKGDICDFSEWPEEWALRNKIIPTCKCGDIMYEWPEIGGWSCEESMVHVTEGGCRYRQRTPPKGFEVSDQGFLDIRCIQLLRKQLKSSSFGTWVDEDTLFKRNKLAYIVLAASYAAGSDNKENATKLLGRLSYSVKENPSRRKKSNPYIMDKSIYKDIIKDARTMMKKHTSGSTVDTEAYMFLKGTHAYDTTHIAHAFLRGGSYGVFSSGVLSTVLKLFDRHLFYLISQVGRPTSFVEVTGIYEHMQHENVLHRAIIEPMVDESYKAIKHQLGYKWSNGQHDDV